MTPLAATLKPAWPHRASAASGVSHARYGIFRGTSEVQAAGHLGTVRHER